MSRHVHGLCHNESAKTALGTSAANNTQRELNQYMRLMLDAKAENRAPEGPSGSQQISVPATSAKISPRVTWSPSANFCKEIVL